MGDSRKHRAPRFRVGSMNVIYDTGDGFWSGPVMDVSESGMFVETHHELPVGTRVTIVPDVPSEEQLPFEIQAEVARVLKFDPDSLGPPAGIAFRLVGLSVEHYEQLRTFLKEHGILIGT